MAKPTRLTPEERAKAATDAARQVQRTLDHHFSHPVPERKRPKS